MELRQHLDWLTGAKRPGSPQPERLGWAEGQAGRCGRKAQTLFHAWFSWIQRCPSKLLSDETHRNKGWRKVLRPFISFVGKWRCHHRVMERKSQLTFASKSAMASVAVRKIHKSKRTRKLWVKFESTYSDIPPFED